jgi:hypothetical protein
MQAVVMQSRQALAGVAIMSQSVLLSGNLVLDLGGINAYDGMMFARQHFDDHWSIVERCAFRINE